MSDDQMWFPPLPLDPTATAMPLSIGDGPYASCGCYIGVWHSILPPPRCPMHTDSVMPAPWLPTLPLALSAPSTAPLRLHPDDVERIARRVVELLEPRKAAPARAAAIDDEDDGA